MSDGFPWLGDRVRMARVKAGLTQKELAARSGVNLSTLTKIEAGDSPNPCYNTCMALCGVLGITAQSLVDENQNATDTAQGQGGQNGPERRNHLDAGTRRP